MILVARCMQDSRLCYNGRGGGNDGAIRRCGRKPVQCQTGCAEPLERGRDL